MKNEPRIQIQDMSPVVDCGRYAAKAGVGDDVRVEATIFRDGHDLLGAELRTKEPGATRWRATPMTELGNDRWDIRGVSFDEAFRAAVGGVAKRTAVH